MNLDCHNFLKWDGRKKGHYEVYFIKFNQTENQVALWIRYTLLVPLGGPPQADLWGFVTDLHHRDPTKQRRAFKASFPLNSQAKEIFSAGKNPFFIQINQSRLSSKGACGAISKGETTLTWDLSWQDHSPEHHLFPYPWMYRLPFPKTKVRSSHPDLRVSGTVQVGEDTYSFRDAPGQQSHLWGSQYAHSWVWAHCNSFWEESAVFEGLSAKIQLAGRPSPPLTVLVLRWRGRLYHLNSIFSIIGNHSHSSFGQWEFFGRGGGICVEGKAQADASRMMGATYTGPGGEKRWCHNSKVGNLSIKILKHGRQIGILSSRGASAMEWVLPQKDLRVEPWV